MSNQIQFVYTLDPNEVESVLQTTSTSPRAPQTVAQPPIKLGIGMERTYQFSDNNQKEGEEVTAQYIAATFAFHEIREEIRTSDPEDTDRLNSLRTNEAQLLGQIRHFQQHPLIIEFSTAVRDSQQKEFQKEQI